MRRCISGFILALFVGGTLASAQQPSATASRSAAGAMILIRACDVVQGRGEEARKWAAEAVALSKMQTQRPFTDIRMYSEVFGHVGRLHFIIEFADFDGLQRFVSGGPEDPKLREMIEQSPTLLRDCRDTLVREVSAPR